MFLPDAAKTVKLSSADKNQLEDLLKSYPTFTSQSAKLTLEEIVKSFQFEMSKEYPRPAIVNRLVGLYNRKFGQANAKAVLKLLAADPSPTTASKVKAVAKLTEPKAKKAPKAKAKKTAPKVTALVEELETEEVETPGDDA